MSSHHITDIEGEWKIIDYPNHPECVGYKIEIKGQGLDVNKFTINVTIINHLKCNLQHNCTTDQWETSDFFTTELSGPVEEIEKEIVFKKLILSIQNFEVHGEENLIIETDDKQKIRLEHLP